MASTPAQARSLWPLGNTGRPRLRIGEDPDAIRILKHRRRKTRKTANPQTITL
jgi:hypothetical protein